MMKFFRPLLCAAVLALSVSAAKAQTALYANFEASDLDRTNSWVNGGTFGIYNDYRGFGPIFWGWDFRGSVQSRNHNDTTKVLGGLRVAFKPPVLPIKPYVQLSTGFGKLDQGSQRSGYHIGYELNGGVDMTVLPHMDWRVVEVGGGSFQGVPGSQFHIATGVVLRFF